MELTAQEVRRIFSYDPETGEVRWLVCPPGKAKPGKLAGNISKEGYCSVGIHRRRYLLHRIIWMHYYGEWPKHTVDHINRNRLDNRICNLRDVDMCEQMFNAGANSRNTSGHKGVHLHRRSGLWMVRLSYRGKREFLGEYKTKDEAAVAVATALGRVA